MAKRKYSPPGSSPTAGVIPRDYTLSFHNRPIAIEGCTSYRYRGPFGWVMIGARDDAGALREAERSIVGPADPARLQRWDGRGYADVQVQA